MKRTNLAIISGLGLAALVGVGCDKADHVTDTGVPASPPPVSAPPEPSTPPPAVPPPTVVEPTKPPVIDPATPPAVEPATPPKDTAAADREQVITAAVERLKLLDADLTSYEARIGELKDDAKAAAEAALKEARELSEAANRQVEEARQATSDTWSGLNDTLQKSLDELAAASQRVKEKIG